MSFGGDALFAVFQGAGAVRRAKATAEAVRSIETLFAEERDAFLPMVGHRREQAGQKEEARQPLVRGYCPEDLPSGLLGWLHEHRPERFPS